MDKIGQSNRISAIFYKGFRILLDNVKLNILRLLRGRSEVQILSGTPMKSMDYIKYTRRIKTIRV
ncbi:MAG: hypothetical protein CK430_15115, partial [Legionella sp.]